MTEPPIPRPANALFNPALTPEIAKLNLERLLGAYDAQDFPDIIETLDRILGKSRLDILSSKTIDRVADEQIKNKNWSPVFWFLGVGTIASSSIFSLNALSNANAGFIIAGLVGIVAGIASMKQSKFLRQKPTTENYNKLMEGAKNPEVARIILDWAKWLILGSIPIYQKDNETVTEIPWLYRKASNMVMVLLGDDRHRQALGVNKHISETPFLFRAVDFEPIFGPLIQALSETEQYAHFKEKLSPEPIGPETELEPQPNPEPEPEPEPVAKTETQTPKIHHRVPPLPEAPPLESKKPTSEKQSASEAANTKTSGSVPRDDYYTLKIWHDLNLLNRVALTTEDPEFSAKEMKGNGTRQKWGRTMRYMNNNSEAWVLYRDNPHSLENREFIEDLFGKENLNTNDSEKRIKFREGGNEYLNNFIRLALEFSASKDDPSDI